MKLPVSRALPFAALILMGAGAACAKDRAELQTAPVTGPAADYPVVVGDPFTIGSTVWTPTDQLNYDAVGYASVGAADLRGVTAAHKTLPLPSYVEVTSLETGKTILVRLERRGPMTNDVLVELSPAAASQLGITGDRHAQIRIRRVNPPEQERAMLRTGSRAPERMETPEGLLKVLRRKLADQSPLLPPPSTPPKMPAGAPPAEAPAAPKPAIAKTQSAKPAKNEKAAAPKVASPAPAKPATATVAPTAPTPSPTTGPGTGPMPVPKADKTGVKGKTPDAGSGAPRAGSLVVQVAALSAEANARKVAAQLGGSVDPAGKLWRVRLGPFANRAQAAAALEKVRHAGYTDARIQSAN